MRVSVPKLVLFGLLLCGLGAAYVSLRPYKSIIFLKDSQLMSQPYPSWCLSGCHDTRILAEIHVGDTALIVEDYDTKDFHVRKIRVKDGKEGYVFDDREFKALEL